MFDDIFKIFAIIYHTFKKHDIDQIEKKHILLCSIQNKRCYHALSSELSF